MKTWQKDRLRNWTQEIELNEPIVFDFDIKDDYLLELALTSRVIESILYKLENEVQ
jgi:hypothetical protein